MGLFSRQSDEKKPFQVLTEKDCPPGKFWFHDCHVYGLSWDTKAHTFSLDLDFISKWLRPTPEKYQFMVSPATLIFLDLRDLEIDLDWSHVPEASMNDINILEQRKFPDGSDDKYFELEFHNGGIYMWSSGYELRLRAEPKLGDRQTLR